jgi:hypothetical protein
MNIAWWHRFSAPTGRGAGLPLSDEILDGARRRPGLGHATIHELRHMCLT